QKFKSFKDIPINFQQNHLIRIDKKLIAHGTYVMYTIGMLVDNLERPDMMRQMLKRLSRNHYRRRISLKAFERLRDTLLEHLSDILGKEIFHRKTMIAWHKAFGYLLKEIESNFQLLDSDIERSSSYYRLNSLHHNATHELLQDYRRNY
ncbi:globin-like protein, partial [Euroglyphus maynei]